MFKKVWSISCSHYVSLTNNEVSIHCPFSDTRKWSCKLLSSLIYQYSPRTSCGPTPLKFSLDQQTVGEHQLTIQTTHSITYGFLHGSSWVPLFAKGGFPRSKCWKISLKLSSPLEFPQLVPCSALEAQPWRHWRTSLQHPQGPWQPGDPSSEL